ncbi:hypothetical protein ACFSVJ_06890 [Prauserella oleivorans]
MLHIRGVVTFGDTSPTFALVYTGHRSLIGVSTIHGREISTMMILLEM